MTTKTVYLFDHETGAPVGEYAAQESPLEPGIFIVPTNAVDTPPPVADVGKIVRIVSGAWVQEDLPIVAATLTSPPFIPNVTPRQMRMALTRAGLRQAVETAVAAGDQDLKDWWEFSTTFERNRQQVIDMAAQLGVSPSSVDQLWILGATL